MMLSPDIRSNVEYFDTNAPSLGEERAPGFRELELVQRFSDRRAPPFGTAGARAEVGPGTSRLNRLTVGNIVQGVSAVATRDPSDQNPIAVVGYDARTHSPAFAELTQSVFCGNIINVKAFDRYAPTPLVAFSLLYHGAKVGVVITASHNPASDHGIKVFWENGAQINSPLDEQIAASINSLGSATDIIRMDRAEAQRRGLLEFIGGKERSAYLQGVAELMPGGDYCRSLDVRPTLIYSAMNGVAGSLMYDALRL
ncbi:MAG: hypothetical protein KDD53_04475, partial [Bdellovibrionales bacterium]|nr:hypothetical protein [Bdellovibrionales bacterium]